MVGALRAASALDCAVGLRLTFPILQTVDRLCTALAEHGGAELDHSGILLELKRLNGDFDAVRQVTEALSTAPP